MKLNKIISVVLIVVVSIASIYGYKIYKDIFSPNTKFEENEIYVYIPSNSNLTDVENILAPYVLQKERIKLVAQKSNYESKIKSGKFLLKKGMNSLDIIRALRINIPVKLSFNNQETIEKLAGRIAAQIEPDSLTVLKAITNPNFLKENEITEANLMSLFIPNSYEFYWNTSTTKFTNTMVKEYHRFWNQERLNKAKAIGLTPLEVSTLASIVHKETVKNDERPRVAGVYLNRLQRGMKLDADPTIIYAVKKQSGNFDQVIKRVYFKDLELDSPYNTYKYAGLPPGPITMPDISAIDAVLNAEKHSYLFFCANVENFGYHKFATNLKEHGNNRRDYIRWINKQATTK